MTPAQVLQRLADVATPEERAKIERRLAPGEHAMGVRMGTLFDLAKEAVALAPPQLDELLAEPAYEPRMLVFCVLDFQARRRLGDVALHDFYLARHDRITAWDMVDRAAPRVVGAHVAGTDLAGLHDLARHDDPLRRRTAVTAPLWFVKQGTDDDLAGGFALAADLASDPEPVVSNAVGIFLAHAGRRDPVTLLEVLDEHAPTMARPALRLAVRHLGDERSRYVG